MREELKDVWRFHYLVSNLMAFPSGTEVKKCLSICHIFRLVKMYLSGLFLKPSAKRQFLSFNAQQYRAF